MYFHNGIIHNYKVMGHETLHLKLPFNPHTHNGALTDISKAIFVSISSKEIYTYSFSYVSYHLIRQYPSLIFPISPSRESIPTSCCPRPPHYAPAGCGMVIHEQM